MKKRFDNILILSDIDGTFIVKPGIVPERNIEAVERFKADGGLFTFNTGRTHSNLYAAVPTAGEIANAPAALSNGAYLYDVKNRVAIDNYFMNSEACREFSAYIRENFKDLGMRASTSECFLAADDDERAIKNIMSIRDISPDDYSFLPMEEWRYDNWYKLVALGDPERLEVLRDELNTKFEGKFTENGGFVCEKSGKRLLEIHRADRFKATVIDTYRRLYADRGELRVYAVGDYENDREVLLAADVSVCPENSLDGIKEICDLCLCSNEDGVIADLIERLYKEYKA